MYIIQQEIDETSVPRKFQKTESVQYREIWDKLDEVDPNKFLPIKWSNWGEAERFSQACKTKKLGKKDRPNPYADLEFKRMDDVVYIKGRKGLALWQTKLELKDTATIN